MTAAPRPVLDGLRVVDFTRVMSGPLCTAMLADLGAEVIKIEDPRGGDISRQVPPFVGSESAYFAVLNRNKKSVALDLKSDEGRQVAEALMASADVVVENFRPGVMARLGLGWEAARAANPRLVYASISGFGQSGAFAGLPAYDLVIQAMSGLMHATGAAGGPATAVGESITDATAGLLAAWAVMVALYDRERTGRGRHLDVAMMDSILSLMATNVSQDLNAGPPSERRGSRHPATCPVDAFEAADGGFVLVCFGDGPFTKLAAAIGRPELAEDPRFASNAARLENEPALKDILNAWAAGRPVETVLAELRAADIPSAPIWSIRDLAAQGYLDERGLARTAVSPDGAEIAVTGPAVRFGAEPAERPATLPALGADTDSVLVALSGRERRANTA